MTPDEVRATIGAARARPRMFAPSPETLASLLFGLLVGACGDARRVSVAWADPGDARLPTCAADGDACDRALRACAALWPEPAEVTADEALRLVREHGADGVDAAVVSALALEVERLRAAPTAPDALDDATSREVLAATAAAVAEALGLTAAPDVVAAQLDQHVTGLGLRLKRVARERDEAEALVLRQATLLLRTADALKGPPPPLSQHSAHDLPEVAAALKGQLAETEAEARRALDEMHRRLEASEAERDATRERTERNEAALRVVALWLGGPRQSSQAGDVEELARATRRELDALHAVVASVRREHDARAAWLASLPSGACSSPPPQTLLDAEAATRAALREVP